MWNISEINNVFVNLKQKRIIKSEKFCVYICQINEWKWRGMDGLNRWRKWKLWWKKWTAEGFPLPVFRWLITRVGGVKTCWERGRGVWRTLSFFLEWNRRIRVKLSHIGSVLVLDFLDLSPPPSHINFAHDLDFH